MAHVGLLDTSQSRRHIPFLFHVIGKVEHAIQRLPLCASVFAAEEAYRTDTHINDSLVVRVHRKGAHVPLHDFFPALAAVPRSKAAVESHGGEHDLWFVATAGQGLECPPVEKLTDFFERTGPAFHDFHASVQRCVIPQVIGHKNLLWRSEIVVFWNSVYRTLRLLSNMSPAKLPTHDFAG